MRVVYLHGFASSPASTKAQYFQRRFAEHGIRCDVLRLDCGDFRSLTITGQLQVIDQAVRGEAVTLLGSSLGGYLAALYAVRHKNVQRMVLLAPALQFPTRWRNRFSAAEFDEWRKTGARLFYHYGDKADRPLGFQFVEDALQYENEPDFEQPALILHGSRDDVVPVEVSEQFAAAHPNVELKIVPSGHEMTDVLDLLWSEAARFLFFQIR
ncbi:MAG TPA: YqiA/YcfP family alpha/beta fold hydrolase [Bryobacteraceae bacterium]|jgi:pimeloyl-ACP methyl ester carboxylesterase|nr:YqiA/YcfP family alpha/beta fold hydrolase [Bryobacteraceae bacterium]